MRYKYVSVFGLAKSGIAAAKRLAKLGARVLVTEIKPAEQVDPSIVKELQDMGVDLELGGHSPAAIEKAELIVVSPDVHLDIPILEQAKQKGIPIISEIELAYQLLKKPLIAVTGTNGKTTVTTLIGEMLKAGGKKVAVAGNIGTPLISVDDSSLDYLVAEISSYQLETTVDFRPWISVILNIQPDHLERHKTMAEYIKQKQRIFKNQTSSDYLIYNQDDPQVVKMVKGAKSKLIGFSKKKAKLLGLAPSKIKIPGEHNLENSLAAANAADLCSINKETIAQTLRAFPGVEHRIEFVAEKNGVSFYNDSKATNPASTIVAIKTFFGQGIILILGGKDKGVSLVEMIKLIKKKVKNVILLGEAAQRFEQELRKAGYNNIHLAKSLEDAVTLSLSLAKKGDIVLLSPACASFDMFKNFEERGKRFKEICASKL
ncbi:MAG: UDP-N-acetylmuramoyl-L-alanine--D-glutamate ligase [Candidatus Margulisbacteria bacterium]|nr:UDP-N-acetylmuramoyl-L-alanine--D-glutamate ligase [Candidatus Margulisiibacteriota bacterium]